MIIDREYYYYVLHSKTVHRFKTGLIWPVVGEGLTVTVRAWWRQPEGIILEEELFDFDERLRRIMHCVYDKTGIM